MCKIYNIIGSLTTLKSRLAINNIGDFKSVKEIIDFQQSFTIVRQQLICRHEELIEQERTNLDEALQQLQVEIETERQQSTQRLNAELDDLKKRLGSPETKGSKNLFQQISRSLRHWRYNRKIKQKEQCFDFNVEMSISHLVENYQTKNNRYHFISTDVTEAVRQSAECSLAELERKKTTIDGLNNFIYGALGEQKVVKCLENLSDEYFLINDFAVSFSPAIYNRQENDYIKSVQIDHILIGPSGVFLIETKNWSERSIENSSLGSPVQQIKRTSFVLFKLLNNEMSNYRLQLDRHHWGDKKISIKNVIALTNTKPIQEFQYVKVLTVNELLGYTNYFKPSFSNFEVQRIAEFLIGINNQNR